MKIYVPNSAFLGNFDAFLRGFDPSAPERLEITAHEKWISVHPAALAMITALGLRAAKGKVQCGPLEATSGHYLVRMGLMRLLGLKSDIVINEREPAGRFIPITQIKTAEEQTRFITDMIPLLHLQAEQAKTLGYIVSELVRNVIEHAESEHGAILCAQYYAKTNRICIGIADTGLGIRTTITRSHAAASDIEAIRLALMPGITGTTPREGGTADNAGAGLFFIKSIACVNRGFFVLYSGTGFYKLLKRSPTRVRLHADPMEDRHSSGNDFPEWRGTVVGVDIPLDSTEEFSRLLDAIRDTYGDAVRERRRERAKRPRFE